jgi:hypothetical protein
VGGKKLKEKVDGSACKRKNKRNVREKKRKV